MSKKISEKKGGAQAIKIERRETIVPEYGRVVLSKHFVERWMQRIAYLDGKGVTKKEVDNAFYAALKKAKDYLKVFRRKARFVAKFGDFELLMVIAPTRQGQGYELVTVWSPTHNSKEDQQF